MIDKDEKRLNSIAKAIGLFMIFKALFYRDSFAGVVFTGSKLHTYLQFSHAVSFYLFLIIGMALCVSSRFIFYILTYLTCAFTLFGAIYTLAPGKASTFRSVFEIGSHLLLCIVLYWSQKKLGKLRAGRRRLMEKTAE